jgi:hypothetical protein
MLNSCNLALAIFRQVKASKGTKAPQPLERASKVAQLDRYRIRKWSQIRCNAKQHKIHERLLLLLWTTPYSVLSNLLLPAEWMQHWDLAQCSRGGIHEP